MHAQNSLRKQPTLGDANTSFPHEVTSEKRGQKILRERERSTFVIQASLHNQKLVSIRGRANSILMTRHYPDLGSASDWLKICFKQSETLPRTE